MTALAHALPDGQASSDTHLTRAVGEPPSPAPAKARATPIAPAPVLADTTPDLPDGHTLSGAHCVPAVGEPTPPAPAMDGAVPVEVTPVLADTPHDLPDGQRAHGAQTATAVGEPTRPAPAMDGAVPVEVTPVLADPLLVLAADVLDDLERVRIANENRVRQLTRTERDEDGEMRGFELPASHPDVARLAALVDGLARLEHDAELQLKRQLRAHALGPWVKAARGVGDKQGARLLAAIGDPYWNDLHGRPRTVSELWAYCGLHVIDGRAVRRARGQRANWSAAAKMRAHLVAVSIVKAGGPYREVYDAAREKYADAVHPGECVRCGPSGKPAAAGSALSAGHQHGRALRVVAKTVLRDLWREAARLHGAT
jgi:hypothetical protein